MGRYRGMYKGWSYSALAPRPIVVYCALDTEEDREDFIFQQDRAPPHFHFDVRAHLNANHSGSWIGHSSETESPLLP
jgi:hypothetical protein